jgi:prevent-host-death family protein
MEKVISATQARIHFGELMRTVVEHNEPIIVERAGKPEVVVLSVSEYKRLRKSDSEDWLAQVDKVRARIQQELGDRTLPPPEEVIREMREERDAQLLDNLR